MMKRIVSLLLCLMMIISVAAPSVMAMPAGSGMGTDDIYFADGSNVTYHDDGSISVGPTGADGDTPTQALQGTSPTTDVPEALGTASAATEKVSVDAVGVPKDSSLTIREASPEMDAVIDQVAAKVDRSGQELFRYDISVQDRDGLDWQPNGKVRLELDAGKVLHPNQEVYVVHVSDDGKAERIEAKVNAAGKIEFETSGFSTFAGFTVDFEYLGEKFSIDGYETILLSEVFDRLRMPLYVADVERVSFSDETLVSVQKQGEDWLLTSLKAFQTIETLKVTMVSGQVYDIRVTDAITSPYATISIGGTYYDGYSSGNQNGEVTWYLDGDYPGIAYYKDSDSFPGYGDGWSRDETILIDGPGTMQINLQHQRNTSKQYYGGDSCALRLDLHQIKITGGAKVVFRLGGNFSGKEESITIQAYGTGSIFNIQDGSLFLMVGDDTLTYSDDEYTSNITLPSGASKSYFGTSSSSPIPIYLKGKSTTTTALIYAHQGKDESGRQNVVVQDVNFRTAPNRAVMVKCNNMTNLSFTNCTFNSTVASSDGGGPAIYVAGTSDDSYNSGTTNVVDVNRFNLKNCTFSGTSGAGTSNGGAVVSYGDIYTLNIDGCTFKNCTSPKRGGAIALSVDDKTKGNNIYNWFRVKDTKFQNCTSGTHGGAIDISNGDETVIMASNMNFSGCTFVDCTAGNRGGAIRLVVTTGKNSSGTSYAQRDLNVTDCAFSGCTSGSQGGGISIQGTIGNVKISGSKSVTKNGKTETLTFADCESTGTRGGGIAIWCPTVGNVTLENAIFLRNTAASHGGGIQIGDGDATEPISVGAFEASGCTFTDNVCNGGVGGAISLTDGAYESVTVTNCSFTDCIANRFGGAIALKKAAEDEKVLLFSVTGNVSITGCDFSGCQSGYLAATSYDVNGDGVVESEWDPNGDGVKIPVLNGGGGGGAIYLGGTYGGTISIKGTSTKDSTFTNCYTWNNGGAIGVSDDVVTKKMDLQYLDINGCRARDGGNAVHFGSCIVDTLTMDNCTVQNCSYFTDDLVIDIPGTEFDSYGTEVYCSYDANGTFRSIGNATVRATISNCEFLSNTSFDNGGGIYWNANNIRTGAAGTQVVPSLTITGTYFYGNHAERDGGGLYVEAKVDIQDCDFESNIADKRGGAIAQQIYNSTARDLGTTAGESNNLILDPDTKIWGNTAINGGGISITVSDSVSLKPKADGSYINYSIKFQLNGATVHDNYASQNGGGIYYSTTPYADAAIQKKVDHFRKEILIDDGSIYNNQSGYGSGNSGNGGGIYMLSNQVNTDVGGYSWLTVTDGQIYSNIANDGNGGGIFLSGKGAVCTITGGTIGGDTEDEANIARMTDYQVVQTKGCGGGIAIDGGASILMRRPWKVDAQGRYLDKDGNVTTDPAKYVEDETKDGGVVSNNKAHIQGAGIWLNNRKAEGAHNSITINGGTIKDNEITTTNPNSANGGGVFVGSYGSLIMNGGSIYGCVAKGWGGGVFCNNHASFTLNGGTIGAVDTDGDGEVDTDGNFADCGGGIAFQSGGTCTIKGGAVQYNESTGSVETNGGGGIFINSATTVDIQGGDVAYNRSAAQGGGIYGSHMTLIISGGSVTGNTAAYDGGGIHGRSDTSVTMSGGNVTLNNATDGGGIYLRGSYMNMTDGDIEQNTASGNGGGAYLTDAGTITVEGNISGNRANSGKGGGVYATGSGTEVTVKGDIDGNTAGGNGGGVEIREGGELIVTGGNVQNNTTGAGGGGIHCFDAAVTVNSGNIQGNHAAQYAGGIYVGGASVAMVDGSVQDNTTDGNGGGIHCASDADKAPVLTIYGNVEGNKAVAHGGGVYAKTISGTVQPSITILHGSIMDNHANCAYDENGALRSGSSANTGNGGGVYLEDASLTLTGDQREDGYFLNGMIQNNSAVNGGGVYAIDATITVTGGIRENEAKYVGSGKTDMGLGGGLYAMSDNGTTTISMAGNIPYNKAQTSGGGVYLTGTGTSDGTTYKTSFIQTTGYIFGNEAFNGDGGGIMVTGNASADIEGGIIRQNKALKGYGGGINVAEGGNVILNGGTIMANLADHGGGIAAETATALTRATVSGGDITGNYAYYGGGIYARGERTTVIVRGGTVTSNEARSDYAQPDTTQPANGYGGGICVIGAVVQVNKADANSTAGMVTDNKAAQGGGVYVTDGGDLTVLGGYIIENYAYGIKGSGSAYVSGEDLDGLTGIGGGIFVSDGLSASDRSTFTLKGEDEQGRSAPVAIYGNIADFAADDVYANGTNTQLDVPKVGSMDLTKYEKPVDSWVEDYAIADSNYSLGLNGLTSTEVGTGTNYSNVVRYRGAPMVLRVPVSESAAIFTPNVTDAYVCMTLGVPGIIADRVIIDYGLRVDIDVMANDNFSNPSNVLDVYVGLVPETMDEVNQTAPTGFTSLKDGVGTLLSGNYGKIGFNAEGKLVYRLDAMTMEGKDQFCYVVKYQIGDEREDRSNIYYYYTTVTVVPANTLYFEDNFISAGASGLFITYTETVKGNQPTNGWHVVGSPLADVSQDVDQFTLTDADLDIVYGYDSHYEGKYQFSMGGALKTTVYDYGTSSKTASAVFRFTGTGFDVISLTSNKTGTLLVNVFELNDDGTRKDSYNSSEEFKEPDTVVNAYKTLMVDTYYGYTLNDKGEWVIVSGDDETALYQIPVINVYDLPYGTYEVELYVAYDQWFGRDQYADPKYDFILDGIRIYDPVEDPDSVVVGTDGNGKDVTLNGIYVNHGEAYPTYHELRDQMLPTDKADLIGLLVKQISLLDTKIRCERDADKKAEFQSQRDEKQAQLDALIGGAFGNAGAVYIDGGKEELTIGEAGFYGPNNEVYLNKGGVITTTLNTAGTNVASVYLGLKSVKGGEGIVKIYEGTELVRTIKVSSATDMYYDISGLTDLTIENASEGDAVIAITNVKVGYTADPYGTDTMDSQLFSVDTEHLSAVLLMLADTGAVTDPQLTLKAPSLSFEDEVFYNVYFTVGDMTDVVEMGLMLLPSMMADGTMEDAIGVIPGYQTNGAMYMVRTDGIPAAQMGDTVYFKVYAKLADGTYAYSTAGGYNAKAYADTILNGEYADTMKALVVSMLTYGAEAQKFFGHNTGSLMDAGLTAEQKALISSHHADMMDPIVKADSTKTGNFVRVNSNFKQLYPSVSFDGAFSINYYCTPAITVDSGMTLYWWDAEDYASLGELTVGNATGSMEMTATNGQYWGSVDGIAAKDMDKTYYVTCVFESEGETVTTGVIAYSLGAYCQSKAASEGDAQQAFAQATAVYGYHAKQYFAQN